MTEAPRRRLRVATASLGGCFGCHMSFLDLDEGLVDLLRDHVTLDASPLTDRKTAGPCDVGLIEGGLCNAENVHVARRLRQQCRILVAVGACAITGGLPAQRNRLDVREVLRAVYVSAPGVTGGAIPSDPELPLPLDRVRPLHEVVHVDYFLPGCPPPAEAFRHLLAELAAGREPRLPPELVRYD